MKNSTTIQVLFDASIVLLKQLIESPSLSRNESATAEIIGQFLQDHGVNSERVQNNVYALNKYFDAQLPTLLLNSHHDTVPPNKGYTTDPYKATLRDGKLYGLGSNDAGGSLVALLAVFLFFHESKLPFNIVLAASAEEEISGINGIELLLQHIPKPGMAIVGEPTQMRMAIAEKGLLVLDCMAKGISGHAARDEGENAISKFVKDAQWLQHYSFEKVSPVLGAVHTAVTVVETKNKAHNVIPDECSFVIDARVNELYSFEEIMEILRKGMQSGIAPRSLRLKPSSIPQDHPLISSGVEIGLACFGSPTLSDMALMNFPAVKCGPGDSARSHTADEFIYVEEIKAAIAQNIEWIHSLENILKHAL